MDGVIRTAREVLIDGDQVLDGRNLGGQDDPVAPKADLLRARSREQRRLDHRLSGDPAHVTRLSGGGVFVHQVGQQGLVERAPIGADADRLAVPDRHLDDGAELPVFLLLETDIAGVDAVFVESLGAGRMIGQQLVADIMKIADQRHRDAEPVQTVANAAGRRPRPRRGRR